MNCLTSVLRCPDSGEIPPALSAHDLSKSYGAHRAVDGVSLSVGRGQALGLLGPNGAGKSTTMLLLAGVLVADRGSVTVNGSHLDHTQASTSQLGYAPQSIALYPTLSARENVLVFARLHGMSGRKLYAAIERTLQMAQLTERGNDPVRSLSGGMQRRLNLALATVQEPSVLLLDEPTVGVDPQSRAHVFSCIEGLKAQGTAVVYSTHYFEEAERLCETVVIIDRGKVLATGTVEEIVRRHGGAGSSLESAFLELTGVPDRGLS